MFLTALIVPEFEALRARARHDGVSFSSDLDLTQAKDVRTLYEKEIQGIQKDLPTYERVRRFELLPTQLTVENGEITPTLKVKRKVVEMKYASLIEKMYENVS
jgi:long-chain acyl-CoA synthetase